MKKKTLKVKLNDAELPSSRKALLADIVKDDFYLLAETSLLQFLFSLPLIAAFMAELIMLGHLAEITPSSVFSIVVYTSLVEIPCFGIRYIGRYAAYAVLKKRVHNEGGYVGEIFFDTMKRGGAGTGMIIGILLGAMVCIWQIASVFLLVSASNPFAKGLGVGVLSLMTMLIYVAVEYTASMRNYYDLKVKDCMKNGASFCILGLPASLLYFAFTIGLWIAFAFLSIWAVVALIAVYALWLDGLTITVATLYSHKMYDKYINSVHYTDYVNKGLSVKEEDNNG